MAENIGQRLARIERSIEALQNSPRLGNSSIENTAVNVYDGTGSLRAVVGQQPDGTTGVNVTNGPTPPRPAPPAVIPALAGLAVAWDGSWAAGGITPLDFSRVEVHIGATETFTPGQATLRATFETPQGGTVVLPVAYAEWWVKLRARTTSGKAGPASDSVNGTPRRAAAADIEAGSITAALLAADAINGKTITGSVIQTGVSGSRIVILPDLDGTGVPAVEIFTGKAGEVLPGTVAGVDGTLEISSSRQEGYEAKGATVFLSGASAESSAGVSLTADHVTFTVGTDGKAHLWVPVSEADLLDGTYYDFGPRGLTVAPWFDVAFAPGWGNYGSGRQDVQYRQMPDGTVAIRGYGKPTAGATGGTMFTLDAYVSPARPQPLDVTTQNNVNASVMVNADGTVNLTASAAPGWIGFGNVTVPLD